MIRILPLEREAAPEDLLALEVLFTDMYRYMDEHGLSMTLAPGGAGLWLKTQMPMLGKLNTVVCAWQEVNTSMEFPEGRRMVGFAAGSIRMSPAHLGGLKGGAITHIYVRPDLRGEGVGEELYRALSSWFTSKEVAYLELEVLEANEGARTFWKKLGYRSEYLVMRRKPH